MKRNGNAEKFGARIEPPKGMVSGEGVFFSLVGEGAVPPPRNFFDLLSGNDAFWCILGACFNVSIRRVIESRKAVLCANCQLAMQLSRIADGRIIHESANELYNRSTFMANCS